MLRCSKRGVHGHAQRAVIVRRGTVVMRPLLQGRELGVSMGNLGRAHDADHQNADQREHLQPHRPVLSQSELGRCAHEGFYPV